MLMNGKSCLIPLIEKHYTFRCIFHMLHDLFHFTLFCFPFTLWVGRHESVGPASPFFASGGPQTGIWSAKMEVKEDTDKMKIVFEQNKR